jgi:hypothetical protein
MKFLLLPFTFAALLPTRILGVSAITLACVCVCVCRYVLCCVLCCVLCYVMYYVMLCTMLCTMLCYVLCYVPCHVCQLQFTSHKSLLVRYHIFSK